MSAVDDFRRWDATDSSLENCKHFVWVEKTSPVPAAGNYRRFSMLSAGHSQHCTKTDVAAAAAAAEMSYSPC